MNKYFNTYFEFDYRKLEKVIIEKASEGKGYCCFIDLTSLVYSYRNPNFQTILNNSLVNSCDGSYIAMSVSKIYGKRLKQYIGPEFFEKFIFKKGTHLILGSTPDVYKKIVERVSKEKGDIADINYLSLPFRSVDNFNYAEIAKSINNIRPNYIWVALGAPKQEQFMAKILPHLDNGVLLGVGAALNYFSGEIKDIPKWFKKLHIVWVYRLLTEPKKQIKRIKSIIFVFPTMIKEEIKLSKMNNTLD